MEQTAIDKNIFIEVGICVRKGRVMATGSERGSSTDVTLRWKKVMSVAQWVLLDIMTETEPSE